MTELARQIEALMFVSPDPLPLVRLCEVTDASPRTGSPVLGSRM